MHELAEARDAAWVILKLKTELNIHPMFIKATH